MKREGGGVLKIQAVTSKANTHQDKILVKGGGEKKLDHISINMCRRYRDVVMAHL